MFGKQKQKTVWEKFPELNNIPKEKFPHHLLLIPDGNGRWAKLAHKKIAEGHKAGAEVIKNIYNDLWQLPIKYTTIWGFSGDNWSRTREEADSIMHIIDATLKTMLPDALERKSRIIHLGRKDRIPKFLLKTLTEAEKETKNNKGSVLSIAVDYAGLDQEIRSIKKMVKDKVEITPKTLVEYRDGGGYVPPADLIVRTSGEKRTSDLGWLSINSELAFISSLLPNTSSKDIVEAIIDYTKRDRRFGGRPANTSKI